MNNPMNRRSFFTSLVKMAGVAALAPAALSIFANPAYAQKKRGGAPAAAGGMPLLDPKDAVAKAVKYVEDYKKVPEAKGNHCITCSFYGVKDPVNGKAAGTCTIFPNKLVLGDAWCASWNKKA